MNCIQNRRTTIFPLLEYGPLKVLQRYKQFCNARYTLHTHYDQNIFWEKIQKRGGRKGKETHSKKRRKYSIILAVTFCYARYA